MGHSNQPNTAVKIISICPQCNGFRFVNAMNRTIAIECDKCNGRGVIWKDVDDAQLDKVTTQCSDTPVPFIFEDGDGNGRSINCNQHVARQTVCQNCLGRGYCGHQEYMEASQCTVCYGAGIVNEFPNGRMEACVAHGNVGINHPAHYNAGNIEAIDVIEDWKLPFNIATTVKYIARYEHKGNPKDDLKKAWWYLTRELLSQYVVSEDELVEMLTTVIKKE